MKYKDILSQRLDASESAFASRSLESLRSKVYEVQYPGLKWSQLLPVATDIDPAAETYRVVKYQAVGQAKLGSDYSTPGNRASVIIGEETGVVRVIKEFYALTFMELRRAAMAGNSLPQATANAARMAIEQTIDDVMILGDGTAPYLGLYGIAKQSGTHSYTTAGAWSGLTADQLIAELNGWVDGIVENSQGVEVPDTIALDLASYNLLKARRVTDTAMSVLEYFTEKGSKVIREIIPVPKLATAGAGGVRRGICYSRNPDKVSAILPVAFEQLPPQWEDYEMKTHCHARIGGARLEFPKSVSYLDHTI